MQLYTGYFSSDYSLCVFFTHVPREKWWQRRRWWWWWWWKVTAFLCLLSKRKNLVHRRCSSTIRAKQWITVVSKPYHVFIILSSSWSRLSVQLLITLARKLWNSSLTASGSSSRFVWTHVTLDSDEAEERTKALNKRPFNRFEDEYEFFFVQSQKIVIQEASLYVLSPGKLTRLMSLKKVEPSPDCKMIKLLTFNNLFPSPRHSR